MPVIVRTRRMCFHILTDDKTCSLGGPYLTRKTAESCLRDMLEWGGIPQAYPIDPEFLPVKEWVEPPRLQVVASPAEESPKPDESAPSKKPRPPLRLIINRSE